MDHFHLVLSLIAALVIGKLLNTGGALLAAGVDHRTATFAAILLTQMGEFSFVLAGVGQDDSVIDEDQYGLILAVALGSILLLPFLLRAGPTLVTVAERLPGVATGERLREGPEPSGDVPRHHVVILGFGRVGAVLGVAPERRGIRFTVIEMNPSVVRALRAKGVRAYYGDAGVDALLLRAGVDVAKTLLVATPDLVTARAAIQHAKRINPAIIVVARAMVANEVEVLRTAGADEVAQPEIEAGMELLRHVLLRHDVSPTEVSLILGHRRASFYESDEVAPVYLDDAD